MNGKRTQHDNDASRFIPLPDPDALAADQRVRSLGEPIAAATCSARPLVAHLCRVAHCPKVVSYLRYCGRAGRTAAIAVFGRVEMWRGGCRPDISVAASFVWRCLSGSTMTPFPHPAHRTGH